jgi:flagellar hook-basal body complex protein FliE
MSISAINAATGQAVAAAEFAPRTAAAEMPFARVLTDVVAQAQVHQSGIGHELERIVAGEANGVQDLVNSMTQADLAFRMMLEIRDRLIASYHEVMRMQV